MIHITVGLIVSKYVYARRLMGEGEDSLKNYKQMNKPYTCDEWEDDKEWIAQRLAFLWNMRDHYPDYYCRNGFGNEKEELYKYYGPDNWIHNRSSDLYYGEMQVNEYNRYGFDKRTPYDLAYRYISLKRMRDTDMEGFLVKKHYIEFELLWDRINDDLRPEHEAYRELVRH